MESFEQQMLAHLSRLIEWDREYAEKQIPWYFKTCPWLEPLIGPALREKWVESSSPCEPAEGSTPESTGEPVPAESKPSARPSRGR